MSNGFRLYIGYNQITRLYFINTKGEPYINTDAGIFENIEYLLKHLNKYQKRKAKLINISNDVQESERDRILRFIKQKQLKIIIPEALEKKIS